MPHIPETRDEVLQSQAKRIPFPSVGDFHHLSIQGRVLRYTIIQRIAFQHVRKLWSRSNINGSLGAGGAVIRSLESLEFTTVSKEMGERQKRFWELLHAVNVH